MSKQASTPRLLLLAHFCHPEMGSEPGIGWNRALQAAQEFPTWVLCDEAFNRAAIEGYTEQHGPLKNLHFVYVPPNRWEQRLRRVPGMFFTTQQLWHRRAYKIARQLHKQNRFDLVHQANMCSFREPGYLWKLDAPFVWGPVGGAQNYPWRFLTGAGIIGAVGEAFRNLLNSFQMRFSSRVRKAAQQADAFFAATSTNAGSLDKLCGFLPQVMLETGVRLPDNIPPRDFNHGGPLRLLWSGVFEHRKALHLLLHALAALPPHVKYELHILGRGPMDRRWRNLARRLGVDQHCRWLGWLDQAGMREENLWADLFVFTSLRDTSGTVVLETFAAGTPVVCLDHQGMADMVTQQCGVKIPVITPRQVIATLSNTLAQLSEHRQLLQLLSRGALQRARYYSWEEQGRRMADVYRSVLKLHDPGAASESNRLSDRQVVTPDHSRAVDFADDSISAMSEIKQSALPALSREG